MPTASPAGTGRKAGRTDVDIDMQALRLIERERVRKADRRARWRAAAAEVEKAGAAL